ncbi:MAG: hypothetical protein J0H85_13720 [Sediminibacterium magnilacihabitans]|jgi:hypothetical protein|nr:hypothetical protein [Sediminibacterium magnilacihabitans]PQV59487.1 hypothetical protein CLV53_11848 [Sediminibacterium magnilacihabitans]
MTQSPVVYTTLSPEECADPAIVISELFLDLGLPIVKQYMWEGLKATVSGTFYHLSKRERELYLILYEHLEQLVEAAHILHEQKRTQ